MSQYSSNSAELQSYLLKLEEHIDNYKGTNPFWQEITQSFHNTYKKGSAVKIKDMVTKVNAMPRTNYLIHPISKQEFHKQWLKLFIGIHLISHIPLIYKIYARFRKGENYLAAIFLARHGHLNSAKDFLLKAKLKPSYVNLRHFFYLQQLTPYIETLLSRKPEIHVLEIGAGGGTLKQLLKQRFGAAIKNYTIIDLPEMLCISCYSSMEFQPEEPIKIIQESKSSMDSNIPNIFVPAGNVDTLETSPQKFDLILNTHSFQEMDDSIIASYFELIYKNASSHALFFNTNWVQSKMTRLNGAVYNNDPKNYPYQNGDQVEFFAADPFHDYLAKAFGYKVRTPTHTSIRWINVA